MEEVRKPDIDSWDDLSINSIKISLSENTPPQILDTSPVDVSSLSPHENIQFHFNKIEEESLSPQNKSS